MLAKIGYELYHAALNSACLTHGAIENDATRRWKRMDHPILGDLVIELSTGAQQVNAIGYLEKVVEEPVQPWDEEENEEPAPLEKVTYIRLLMDSSTCRWTNARFVTILPVEGWPK
jgi:hypothetical protein